MHVDGHNYKALAITYDPSPQMQGTIPVSQGMKHTQSSQEFWSEPKAGPGVELQWDPREPAPLQGWAMAARSSWNLSPIMFVQALILPL